MSSCSHKAHPTHPLQERELQAQFGDDYRELKRGVQRFPPRLVGWVGFHVHEVRELL